MVVFIMLLRLLLLVTAAETGQGVCKLIRSRAFKWIRKRACKWLIKPHDWLEDFNDFEDLIGPLRKQVPVSDSLMHQCIFNIFNPWVDRSIAKVSGAVARRRMWSHLSCFHRLRRRGVRFIWKLCRKTTKNNRTYNSSQGTTSSQSKKQNNVAKPDPPSIIVCQPS